MIGQGGREGEGGAPEDEEDGVELALPPLPRKSRRVELQGGAQPLADLLSGASITHKSEHDQKLELGKQHNDHALALSKQGHDQGLAAKDAAHLKRMEWVRTGIAVAVLLGVAAASVLLQLPPDRSRDLFLGGLMGSAATYLFKK